MRQRHGQRQVAILRYLAEQDGGRSLTIDLAYAIDHTEPGYDSSRYSSVQSAIRRSLAIMRRQGLVSSGTWYADMRGRPVIWEITQAGRDFLASRARARTVRP